MNRTQLHTLITSSPCPLPCFTLPSLHPHIVSFLASPCTHHILILPQNYSPSYYLFLPLPHRDKNIFSPDRFMKYFIRLSYNGAPFSGWQIQKNANSVQEELQKAFSTLLKEIVVKNIFKMPTSAHARFDAVSRTYKYFLTLEKEPFNSAFTYFYRPGQLDFVAMNKAAKYFLGEQDFTSLEKLHSGAQNAICNVTAAGWERITANTQHTAASGITATGSSGAADSGSTAAGNGGAADSGSTATGSSGATFIMPCSADIYVYTVTANRFLRNMVRSEEHTSELQSPDHLV